MIHLCRLDELELSCMGCCGSGFGPRPAVEAAIRGNGESFRAATDPAAWGRRLGPRLGDAGVCGNLVLVAGRVVCPLHPALNRGVDLRDPWCDRAHVCATYATVIAWDEARQRRLLRFLAGRRLDWYEYSMAVDSGALLAEFAAARG